MTTNYREEKAEVFHIHRIGGGSLNQLKPKTIALLAKHHFQPVSKPFKVSSTQVVDD